ncbi:MAG: hypothetical protein ACJ76K_06330 [Solirubrobacteraceae bacterium]
MNRNLTPLNGTTRRRRPPRALGLYTTLPDDRTAAAMADAEAAEQLVADLIALVDAGLVAPIEDDGEIRYAPVDDDERDAA